MFKANLGQSDLASNNDDNKWGWGRISQNWVRSLVSWR